VTGIPETKSSLQMPTSSEKPDAGACKASSVPGVPVFLTNYRQLNLSNFLICKNNGNLDGLSPY
jgi:hypothetical protein